MMQFLEYSTSFDANKLVMAEPIVIDDEMWFENAFDVEAAPPAVSQEESFDHSLMIVESVEADDPPNPGIYAENFNDMQNQQQFLYFNGAHQTNQYNIGPPINRRLPGLNSANCHR